MIQLALMAAISLLAAILAGGAVWIGWGFVRRVRYAFRAWRDARKQQAETEDSGDQAEEPAPGDRPA